MTKNNPESTFFQQRSSCDRIVSDQDVIEALQTYFRESALTHRTQLPRWAIW